MEFRRRKDDHRVFPLGGNNATIDAFMNLANQEAARKRLAGMNRESVELGSGAISVFDKSKIKSIHKTDPEAAERVKHLLEQIKEASPEELREWKAELDEQERAGKLTNKEGLRKLRDFIDERMEIAEKRQARDPSYQSPLEKAADAISNIAMQELQKRQQSLGNDTGVPLPESILYRIDRSLGYDKSKELLKKLDTVNDKSLGEWHDFVKQEFEANGVKFQDKGMPNESREALRKILTKKIAKMEAAQVEAKKRDDEYKVKQQEKAERIQKLLAGKLKIGTPEFYRAVNDEYDSAIAAKFLRQELKEKFPGVKFSVKTEKYSGGSSINVHWTDGPKTEDIENIVKQYSEDLGSDPQSDYFNVNRYAFAKREYSQEAQDKAKKQYEKDWGKPYNQHDIEAYREYYKILRESQLPAKEPPKF